MRLPQPLRFVLRLCIAVAIFLGLLAITSRIVMPKNNQDEFGQMDSAANGILGEPADSIDVVFLGDSESYTAFSPLQLWHERGITSYVCGTAGQPLPYTYSLLGKALSKQSPNVVVLETNCLFRDFTPGFALLRAAQDAFPVLEYHNRWKSLRVEDLTTAPRTTWTHSLKGFSIKRDTVAADASAWMAPSDELADIPILNRWYLEQINRLCREHGATLVLVSTPSTVNWNAPRHNRVAQLAADLDIAYYDLNTGSTRVDIDWTQDTCDGGDHLNIRGAQKVTTAMGSILGERSELTSHAGDGAYVSWDEAYAVYARQLDQ